MWIFHRNGFANSLYMFVLFYLTLCFLSNTLPTPHFSQMSFWVPGADAPGVDREFEDEGIYMINDAQTRMSIEQQVVNFAELYVIQ